MQIFPSKYAVDTACPQVSHPRIQASSDQKQCLGSVAGNLGMHASSHVIFYTESSLTDFGVPEGPSASPPGEMTEC